jgi:bacterioferritin-associated ferredoxin
MHSEDPVLAVDDEIKHTVREELRRFRPVKGVTSKGGKCMLIMKETLWKNSLNFEKHAPMICVNLIIIVVTDSDKTINSPDGFGGLVVCVLASSSRVRGFEPGRSRWIFCVKNPRHAFLRRGS